MFENSLDAIFETVPDGTILDANPAACSLFGYTVQEMRDIGREGLTDSNDPLLDAALRKRQETGKFTGEITMVKKGGEKIPVQISTSGYSLGNGEERTVLIVRDITEKRRLDNILIEREAGIRSMIENTDGSIWMIDRDLKLIAFNTAFQNRFGRGTGRNVRKGDDVTISIPESIREEWIGYYKKGLSGKRFSIQTATVPPLEKMYIKYHFNPITDIDGNIKGLTITGHNTTDQVKLQKELSKRTREIQNLLKHSFEERELENHLIAGNLHDDLGQKLTALKLNIAWLRSRIGVQSAPVDLKFSEMNRIIDDSVESINRIVHGLRPSMLDDLGLKAAVEWLTEDFNKKSGISVTLNFNPSEFRVDEKVALAVFRIIQESLTNIIRHAKATHVMITLITGKELKVIIEDNGTGINKNRIASPGSFGINIMAERAQSLGGSLKISAGKGGGTIVTAVFSLKKVKHDKGIDNR